MSNAAGIALNCTANDLGLASFSVTNVIEPCERVGDTMTVDGTVNVSAGGPSRFDLGFYIGRDGAQAQAGTDCHVSIRPASQLNLDGDQCGDHDGSEFSLVVPGVTVACVDEDDDGYFDLAVCTSYDNNNEGTCNGEANAYPSNGAKCQCDQPLNTNLPVPYCETNADCDDANPCTTDTCLVDGGDLFGCSYSNNTGPCNDGTFCNGADSCSGGTCNIHAGDPCSGGGECADTCDEQADLCARPAGTACSDDGNLCTDDFCDGAGACAHPNNADPCDDGLFCNGTDTCQAGACVGAGDPCSGGGECADSCDEAGDDCFDSASTPCADEGNVCTDDVCDGAGSCSHPARSGPCDDGLFCTATDTCQAGACVGSGDPCDAGPECADTCNEVADDCLDPATAACTEDGNPCTDDRCDGAGSCTHPNNTASCDDGLFCTETDVCAAGACVGTGDPCGDGALCNDACNETADDCVAPDLTDCSDQCTVGICQGGVCIGEETVLSPTCRWIAIAGTGPVDGRITTKQVGVRSDGSAVLGGSTCGYYTKRQQGTVEGHFVTTAGVGEGSSKGVGIRFGTNADVWGDIVTGGSTLSTSKKAYIPGTELLALASGAVLARTDAEGAPAPRIADTTGLHPLLATCDADQELLADAVPILDALPSALDVVKVRVKPKKTTLLQTDGTTYPFVIDASTLKVGARGTLLLSGSEDDVVIVRIGGDFSVGFEGNVGLEGGLKAENVLFYAKGRRCKTARAASGVGSLFCPYAKKLQLGFGSDWVGTFLGGIKDLRARRYALLVHSPFSGF